MSKGVMSLKNASEIIEEHFQTLNNREKECKIEAIRTPGKKDIIM